MVIYVFVSFPSFADHYFGHTRILCVHIFLYLLKQLHHHLEWGFGYGKIEFSRQQSSLEHGQYNLVFCLIELQQLLIEAGYILPQSFSFLLMNVEKMSSWLLVSLSSDEMTNKTLTELFKVCNGNWGYFAEPDSSYTL